MSPPSTTATPSTAIRQGAPAATARDFLGGGEGKDTFNGDGTGGAAASTPSPTARPTPGGLPISVDLDDVADDADGYGNHRQRGR